MLHDIALFNCARKLTKRIDKYGYSFENLAPVWKDKYTVFILVFLVIKAICNIFCVEKVKVEKDEKTYLSKKFASFIIKIQNLLCHIDNSFFLVKRFATSL